jgi:guanosine-3',5'-bis(diphosphate) 3'-pyrophosphohydrolase
MADKICNLRDLNMSAPTDWSTDRIQEYFEWANKVVENLRGVSPDLEAVFDEVHSKKPER